MNKIPNSTIAEETVEKLERQLYTFQRLDGLSNGQVREMRAFKEHLTMAFDRSDNLPPELRSRIGKLLVRSQPVLSKFRAVL